SLSRSPILPARPAIAALPRHRLPVRAGKAVRSSSIAGNRRPPQSREQPHGPLGCLAGPAGVSGLKDYLTSAQAYALISIPTAISIMTGVFHFMALSSLRRR